MKARGVVRVAFASEAEAQAVARALAPENEGFVTQRVDGATLVAEADAEKTGSLLRTLDDYLANLTAAEKAGRAARKR